MRTHNACGIVILSIALLMSAAVVWSQASEWTSSLTRLVDAF